MKGVESAMDIWKKLVHHFNHINNNYDNEFYVFKFDKFGKESQWTVNVGIDDTGTK